MSKFALIAAAAAAILATPLMSSQADAGGCGGYGGFGGGSYSSRSSYQSYSSSSYTAQPRRIAKPKARLAIAKPSVAKPVRAAALKSKSVASSAAPVVFIPNNSSDTSTVVANATEDQASAQIKVAAIETPESTQGAANEAATTAEPAKAEAETVTNEVPNDTKRVCRRYSPATGGMVEVACE